MVDAPLTESGLLRARAVAQGLAGHETPAWVLGAVTRAAGMQAQDRAAAGLGVRARARGVTAADVDAARRHGDAVVTWCMRGTLHLVPAADARWLVRTLAPGRIAQSTRRLGQLGLDPGATAAAVAFTGDELQRSGPRTRAELGAALVAAGHPVDPATQSLVHVLGRAALEGIHVLTLREDGEEAFALVDDVLPPAGATAEPEGDAALAELARRHARAFGPAAPEDLAAWAKLPLGTARRAWEAIADELVELAGPAGPLWAHRDAPDPGEADPDAPDVRLLGAFDTALLGHRDRDLLLAPEHRRAIQPGGGIVHPAVLVEGRVVGRWRLERRSDHLEVAVEPFRVLGEAATAALEVEAADVGRYLGGTARLAPPDADETAP